MAFLSHYLKKISEILHCWLPRHPLYLFTVLCLFFNSLCTYGNQKTTFSVITQIIDTVAVSPLLPPLTGMGLVGVQGRPACPREPTGFSAQP